MKKPKPIAEAPASSKHERTLCKRLAHLLGEHKFALEYAVVEYVLQGFTAATIVRKLEADYPELQDYRINEGTLLYLLGHAIESGVITMHKPRLHELEAKLKETYQLEHGHTISFYVADDTIGFRHARSMTSFFWGVAADAIAEGIESLLSAGAPTTPPDEIVVGNTGGPSVSEAIKYLSRLAIDPAFLDDHRDRLWFLSLTAAGTAEHFDVHSNFLAALLGQIYKASHMAVANPGGLDPDLTCQTYDRRIENMRMLIGGVGSDSGYLMNWFQSNKVRPPAGMIGDIFFHPVGRDGNLLVLDEGTTRALAPLQLRPTKDELHQFIHQPRGKRALVIVTEQRTADRKHIIGEKQDVLDVVLRAGYVTDCVLTGDLAQRLLLRHALSRKR